MDSTTLAAGLLLGASLVLHAGTTLLTWHRCRLRNAQAGNASRLTPVTIIRPVHGLGVIERTTLASTFALDYQRYEIIFCAERETDPAVPFLRRLIANHPRVPATLLIGTSIQSHNPQLDNVEKGWNAAIHEWIILADANVCMPGDYIQRLLAAWTRGTGLVSAPPIGSAPATFWAEVECAFLNTYQARWQYATDFVGYGFAQGKNLLWRRADLEAAGGIRALATEVAEDAAATKLVRSVGKSVRLADRPFDQPLGARSARQVWERQLRWAQLRRWSFPAHFAPEFLTSSLIPLSAGVKIAVSNDLDAAGFAAAILAFWYATEALLARACGWHVGWRSPAAWLLRDIMIPIVWLVAHIRRGYAWQGKTISGPPRSLDQRATVSSAQ